MKSITVSYCLFIGFTISSENGVAQGTTYLSSLDQVIARNLPVGADSWVAAQFSAGEDPAGYFLTGVQLTMGTATGAPGGFTVSVFSSDNIISAIVPGTPIGTLTGPVAPEANGDYTYSSSTIELNPSTPYWLVISGSTPIDTGAFQWAESSSAPSLALNGWVEGATEISADSGVQWTGGHGAGYPEIAFSASVAPEPSVAEELILGGGFVVWRRLRIKR